jgi:hypothetical protein
VMECLRFPAMFRTLPFSKAYSGLKYGNNRHS